MLKVRVQIAVLPLQRSGRSVGLRLVSWCYWYTDRPLHCPILNRLLRTKLHAKTSQHQLFRSYARSRAPSTGSNGMEASQLSRGGGVVEVDMDVRGTYKAVLVDCSS